MNDDYAIFMADGKKKKKSNSSNIRRTEVIH